MSDKFTGADSYRLTKKEWLKTVDEAFQEDRNPVMEIDISGTRLYVIDESMFELLQEAVE